MKTRISFATGLLSILVATGVAGGAQTAVPAANAPRELAIVVVAALRGGQGDYNAFNRIDRVFTEVFEAQKWPMKIAVERFGANSPAHEIELRVYARGISRETPVDLVFSAWVTLSDRGKKEDFGVIRFRYYPRPTESIDDQLDHAVRGAALAVVEKVRPFLFPTLGEAKP